MVWNTLLLLTGDAAAAAGEAGEAGGAASMVSSLVMMAAIFAVFYFLMIRPQRKKDKAAKEMLKQLKVGDRVCTIGGVYGTLESIKDDVLVLSVGADKVKLVFARWAIRNVEEVSITNDSETLV